VTSRSIIHMDLHKLNNKLVGACHNPSLWLATKAKGLQGCEPSSRPGRHITCSRECKECKECKESRECEGVNPHTPK